MTILRILPRMFSRQWILATLLVLAGAAVCARLGIWQLDRLDQRRAFNNQVLSMRALPPLDISAGAPDDIAAMEYRAVVASGMYDFENQVAIRNQYYNGMYGYDLLTPLRLADGTAVLVDRGWVAAEGAETREGWSRYDGPQPVRVEGVIRLSQAESTFGGVTDPTLAPGQTRLDFWTFVNVERIGRQAPYRVLPVYIQQTSQAGAGAPIPHPEELELTEGPHFGYALQWFA
ncbi:MAG: SURF1 family protein, partial [Chloroflexota bacterium]